MVNTCYRMVNEKYVAIFFFFCFVIDMYQNIVSMKMTTVNNQFHIFIYTHLCNIAFLYLTRGIFVIH